MSIFKLNCHSYYVIIVNGCVIKRSVIPLRLNALISHYSWFLNSSLCKFGQFRKYNLHSTRKYADIKWPVII